MKILKRNFHSRWGEIDIVGLDRETLCFIEVRYRQNTRYGSAAESVTRQKQQRIIKTAQTYLRKHKCFENQPARFDIVSISGDLAKPQVDWYKSAFMMQA